MATYIKCDICGKEFSSNNDKDIGVVTIHYNISAIYYQQKDLCTFCNKKFQDYIKIFFKN